MSMAPGSSKALSAPPSTASFLTWFMCIGFGRQFSQKQTTLHIGIDKEGREPWPVGRDSSLGSGA